MPAEPLFNSTSFTEWQLKGVTWLSVPEAIAQFFTDYFPGFNLFELLTDLHTVVQGRGFEWTAVRIRLMESGNLRIEHEYDNLEDEEPLSLIRTLHVDMPRRASHEQMVLPPYLQRRGLSRELIQAYYRQYQQAHVELILIQAGLSGGGYAWAKYGFAATRREDVFRILDLAADRGIDSEAIQELRNDAQTYYRQNSTPFPIESWARLPFGEQLLVGTMWQGQLDLHNHEQVQIFEAYLYGR